MARGDGRVWQRGGRFWFQYSYRNKQHREAGGRTEAEARRKLRARLAEIHVGTFVGPARERTTIKTAVGDYLAAKASIRSIRTLKVHFKPVLVEFGTWRASELTTPALERYKQDRLGAGRAAATVNRELEALRSALRHGDLPRPKFPMMELDNVRTGYFTAPEVDTLLQHIPDPDVQDFVAWAFRTGMRRGEIARLEWSMLDKNVLFIPGTITKNKKGRSFGFAGEAAEIMSRRVQARRLGCPLIFHREGRPMGPFRDLWRSALKRAGLPQDRLVHDLRRSAVRHLVQSGVDPLIAMKVSGHRTRSMLDRYSIVTEQETAAAMKRVDNWVAAAAVGDSTGTNPPGKPLDAGEEWCRRWDLNPH